MKILHGITVVSCIALCHASPGTGAPQDRSNAAWWYERAAERAGVLSAADWNALGMFVRTPGAPPPAAVIDALSRASQVVSAVREGAAHEAAFYDIRYERGMGTYIPGQGYSLKLSWLMQSDVLNSLHGGNTQGAAESTAAIYNMARHMGQSFDSDLARTGAQLFMSTDRIAAYGSEAGAWTPADAATLYEAVRECEPRDPFNVGDSTVNTTGVMLSWLSDLHERGDAATLEKYLHVFDRTKGVKIEDLSDEEFDGEIEKSRNLLDRVAEIYMKEDRASARAELTELRAEVEAGKHGVLVPWFDNAEAHFNIMRASEAAVAARREALQKMMAGEPAGKEPLNAAVWYLRAIGMLDRIRVDLAEAVARHAERDSEVARKELDDLLLAAQDIVDALREGSRIRRCDFWFGRPQHLAFVPDYVPGMHEALGLLRADAGRLMRAQAPDAAADRLGICFRMIAHLATDRHIESSLVAHGGFLDAAGLTMVLTDRHVLAEDVRLSLLGPVRQLSPVDPFGEAASVLGTREVLAGPILASMSRRDAESDQQKRMAIREWDGDHVLMVVAVLTLGQRPAGPEPIGEAPPGVETIAVLDRTRRLAGVLSVESLALLVTRARSALAQVTSGDLGFVTAEEDVADLGRVEERKRTARADRQRVLELLEQPEAISPGSPD